MQDKALEAKRKYMREYMKKWRKKTENKERIAKYNENYWLKVAERKEEE